MPSHNNGGHDYQDIFHWAETQKDGTIPSFAVRKNDPYEVSGQRGTFNMITDKLSTNVVLEISEWKDFDVGCWWLISLKFRVGSNPRNHSTGSE